MRNLILMAAIIATIAGAVGSALIALCLAPLFEKSWHKRFLLAVCIAMGGFYSWQIYRLSQAMHTL